MTSRILCVFAHPDDEVFCAGGTLAKYAADGCDIMVVSATKGDAGQIRDANIATRRTLANVREQELHESCRYLGVQHVLCLNYGDGTLKDLEIHILVEHVVKIVREFRPDIVITFGPDGAYGHPDHIVIGEATTIACTFAGNARRFPTQLDDGLQTHSPTRLFYSCFPRSPMLLLNILSHWLVDRQSRNAADGAFDPTEFVRALLLFTEEATMLNYSSDRVDVNWYPSGFYIIEQGEVAKDLYLILSGSAEAVLEHDDGTLEKLDDLGPGFFFGELAVAHNQRRQAHVIARNNVTCLVMSMNEGTPFTGRGDSAVIVGGEDRVKQDHILHEGIDPSPATHCLDIGEFVTHKINAMSAHRSQYPITPDMFPMEMMQALLGHEYFVQILPRPPLEDSLFPATEGPC